MLPVLADLQIDVANTVDIIHVYNIYANTGIRLCFPYSSTKYIQEHEGVMDVSLAIRLSSCYKSLPNQLYTRGGNPEPSSPRIKLHKVQAIIQAGVVDRYHLYAAAIDPGESKMVFLPQSSYRR